jgi:hypothetical protein
MRYASRSLFNAPAAARHDGPEPSTSPEPAADLADTLIAWFYQQRDRWNDLPTEPFDLRPGEHIANPELFYRALETDITAGPTGEYFWRSVTRARWSPLLGDLSALKQITEQPR